MAARKQWRHVAGDDELKKRIMKQHDDVYSVAWSPDGKLLAAASVNHMTIVWDANCCTMVATLRDHTHFVQGVGWDPIGTFLATQSSDRTLRLYGHKEDKGIATKRRKAAQKQEPNPCPDLPGYSQGDLGQLKNVRTLKYLVQPSPSQAEVGNVEASRSANEVAAALAAKEDQTHYQQQQQQQAQQLAQETVMAIDEPKAGAGAESAIPLAMAAGEQSALVTSEEAALSVAAPTPDPTPVVSTTKTKAPPKPSLFADENVRSFFRRLDWTPDGALLLAPAGIFNPQATAASTEQTAVAAKASYATWVFQRTQLDSPVACLPGLEKPSVAVRSSPRLYAPRNVVAEMPSLLPEKQACVTSPATESSSSSSNNDNDVGGNNTISVDEENKEDTGHGIQGSDEDSKKIASTSGKSSHISSTLVESPVTLSPQAVQATVAAQDIEVQVNGSTSVVCSNIGDTLKAHDNEGSQLQPESSSLSNTKGVKGGGPSCSRPGACPFNATAAIAPMGAMTDIGEHRCVFAVMTLDDVLVYDTHQATPLAIAKQLHYAGLTDAAWSADGRSLAVSSSDGYISILSFGEAEIGTCLDRSAIEAWRPKSRFAPVAAPKQRIAPTPVAPPITLPPQVNGSNSVVSPSIGGTLKAPKGAVPVQMDPVSVVRPAMTASGISAMQLAVPTTTTVNVLQPKSKKRRVAPEPAVAMTSPVPTTNVVGAAPVSVSTATTGSDLLSPPLCPAPGTTGGGSPEAAKAAAPDFPIETAKVPLPPDLQQQQQQQTIPTMAPSAGSSATDAIDLLEGSATTTSSIATVPTNAGVPKKERKRIAPEPVPRID